MTDNIKFVLAGYAKLTPEEKREFVQEINSYSTKTEFQKSEMNEQLRGDVKRILGPTSSGACSCCGRG
jgi:hypothetical protein